MHRNPITIRSLGPEDADVLNKVRSGVFDNPIDPARLWSFLATRVNDMVVALDRGEVIGFAFGTVLMRPDKPTEFFVNEIGVHEAYQRQGIATRLLGQLKRNAIDRGCEGLWVLTDGDNEGARAFYAALGGEATPDVVMFDWDLT